MMMLIDQIMTLIKTNKTARRAGGQMGDGSATGRQASSPIVRSVKVGVRCCQSSAARLPSASASSPGTPNCRKSDRVARSTLRSPENPKLTCQPGCPV